MLLATCASYKEAPFVPCCSDLALIAIQAHSTTKHCMGYSVSFCFTASAVAVQTNRQKWPIGGDTNRKNWLCQSRIGVREALSLSHVKGASFLLLALSSRVPSGRQCLQSHSFLKLRKIGVGFVKQDRPQIIMYETNWDTFQFSCTWPDLESCGLISMKNVSQLEQRLRGLPSSLFGLWLPVPGSGRHPLSLALIRG